MIRRALPLVVVALLAWPLAQAATDPNPVAHTTAAAALDLDAGGPGTTVAGTTDAGNNVNNPSQSTYYLWDLDGSQRASGSIDPNCSGGVGKCTTSARAVAVSGDGQRFAVAGWPNSQMASQVFFGTFNQGVTSSLPLAVPSAPPGSTGYTGQEVLDLDLDDTGSVVVVAGHLVPSVPSTPPATDKGQVTLFRWTTSTPSQAWTTTVNAPATAVRVSADGDRAAVAAGRPIRFDLTASSGTAFSNAAVPGNALDVDIASGSPRWSIVGTDQGYYALFNSASDANPSFQTYQASQTSSPLRAVAMAKNGTMFATGSDAGDLRLFSLSSSAATPVAALDSVHPGAVRDLAFSGDGHYLAVALANSIALYDTSASKLVQQWNATLTGNIGHVAIDSAGDHVIAAAGTQVVVYTAIHRVTRSGPSGTQQLTPGTPLKLAYVFENTGNRAEALDLTAQAPSGWTSGLSVSTLSLPPGVKATVTLNVSVPSNTPPGTSTVQLTHHLASGGGDSILAIPMQVVAHQAWLLNSTQGDARGLDAGQTASFPFTVLNVGNVKAAPAVTVTVDESGWTARVDGNLTEIQPGEILPFNILVTAPATAPQLAAAHIHVRLDGATPMDLTATVGARFGVSLLPLQDLTIDPGASQTFTVQVRNTGNTADGIMVAAVALPSGWTLHFGPDQTATAQFTDVAAGATVTVAANLTASPDAIPGIPVQLTLKATSDGETGQTSSTSFRVTPRQEVASSSSSTTKAHKGAPGPELGLLLAALAVVAVRRRR